MKAKLKFAYAMLQTARLGATKATDAATRKYATDAEAKWEAEVKRLEAKLAEDKNEQPEPQAA